MNFLKIPLLFAFAATLNIGAPLLNGGTVLVHEDFSYSNGVLGGQSGGTGFTSAWSGSSPRLAVSGGAVTITGQGNVQTERSIAPIVFSESQKDVYFSFDLAVLGIGATSAMNDALVIQGPIQRRQTLGRSKDVRP